MKTIVYLIVLILACSRMLMAQDAEAQGPADAAAEAKLQATMKQVQAMMDDPNATDKEKAEAGKIALEAYNLRSRECLAYLRELKAQIEVYDSLVKVCDAGILPDGVKPDPYLYPYVKATTPASTAPPSRYIGQKILLTLADGTVKSGTVVKIDSEGVTLLTNDGGGKVLFSSMNDADKANFGYNPP